MDVLQSTGGDDVALPHAGHSSPAGSVYAQSIPQSQNSTSTRSSATVRAKKLAAQLQHARRRAELVRTTAEAELKVSQLELDTEIAFIESMEEDDEQKSTRSDVQQWLDCNIPHCDITQPLHITSSNINFNQSQVQSSPVHPIHPDSVAQATATESATAPAPVAALPQPASRDYFVVPAAPPAELVTASASVTTLQSGPDPPQRLVSRPTQWPAHIATQTGYDHQRREVTNNQSSDISNLARAIASLGNNQPKHNIKLPSFDGKSPSDWLVFKRSFNDSRDSYTAAQNLARLSCSLHDIAREAVAMLLVSAQSPDEVMSVLETRFARPEVIILQQLSYLRALPRLSFEGKDINIFSCRVRNCVETVKLLNQTAYLESPELVNLLISKLTPILRTRWLDYADKNTLSLCRLELFADFICKEADLQMKYGFISDTFSENKQSHFHPQYSNKNKSRDMINTTSIGNSNDCLCIYCQESHKIDICPEFKKLSVDDRFLWIKEHKACYRCLRKYSHTFRTCNLNKYCKVDGCKQHHHKLLHKTNLNRKITESTKVGNYNIGQPYQVAAGSSNESETIAHTSSQSQCIGSTNSESNLRPLLKIIPVTVSGPFGSIDTYALLDDGSTATLIDDELSSKIGARGPKGTIHMDCISGLSKHTHTEYVSFKIKGRHSDDVHPVHKARSIKNLGISSQSILSKDISKYSYLSDLTEYLCYENAKPMLIIGIDNWHLTIAHNVRKGSRSQPVAIQTVLGWVLFGFSCSKTKTVDFINYSREYTDTSECTNHFNFNRSCIENLIREQYKLDSIGITKKELYSVNDKKALQILENTTKRLPSGRFETGLLWNTDELSIPNNYNLALSRFISLERKMARDKNYAELYRNNIRTVLDKGYAEECDQHTSTWCWYLPHFGVTHPHKPKKLRIVHDAAAKYKGVSLNSLLLTGPDLLQSLLGILLRFREGRIALAADIQEMFPQIKIRGEDRDAQRFLWRDNPNLPIKTYRMSSMVFGAASSPCTALYIKNRNAQDYQAQYPEAARAIEFDHYMDDFICSVDNVENASILAADVVKVHKKAEFIMRGWISNNPAALSLIPEELKSKDAYNIELGQSSQSVHTLGVIWQPLPDTITFNTTSTCLPEKLTKRAALSHIMRIYDPIGLLSPLIVRGRVLFQKAWRSGVDWDEELPQLDCTRWHEWFKDMSSVNELRIPRCYLTEFDLIERELHIFSDASELAFATVAYWRFVLPNGKVQLALIGSKVRVTPLKPVSIPRLELQGAILSSRLASTICEVHRHKPTSRIFWCDSMTVLGWIRSDARKFKPFVAHRVGEILESTNVTEWRWIPSGLNVADDSTRMKPGGLDKNSRWICGPEFLLSSPSHWPSEPQVDMTQSGLEELKPAEKDCLRVHFSRSTQLFSALSADPSRFSKWLRMVRATARAHKYITLLRIKCLIKHCQNFSKLILLPGFICTFSPIEFSTQEKSLPIACTEDTYALQARVRSPLAMQRPTPNPLENRSNLDDFQYLTAQDMQLATIHILRRSQTLSFKDELLQLNSNHPIPSSSKLINLSPTLDTNGLIRVTGRIGAALNVPDTTKSPVILHGSDPSTRLLIQHHHEQAAHANNETVVNELRQQYWILKLRSTVRYVARNCQFCRVCRGIRLSPATGNLPEARLAHHQRPFTFVGLDYFGPVTVTIGRRTEKRYVALYTCLTVRAIHLEVVNSLSTDSAIMSLRRFIARRGTPSKIYSDNGTAFVGANNVLSEIYKQAVNEFAANRGIQWNFIPPSAPFMGGAWERLVRSVKTALSVTLQSRNPKEEILCTLLAEAESLINSRPLTYVPTDATDPESLTPYHFLIGSSSGTPLPIILDDADLIRQCNWKKAMRLADHFWRRWVLEYLPTLLPKRTDGTVTQNLKVGDMVMIVDGSLPRGTWPKGLVSKLYPGKDGVVRVVDVNTCSGVLRRPTRKILLIPV